MSQPASTNLPLNVQSLISGSVPVRRRAVFFYVIMLVVFLLLAGSQRMNNDASAALAMLVAIAAGVWMAVSSYMRFQAARQEQRTLEGIEEQMILRYWPDASRRLVMLLSKPVRSEQTRVTGLLLLTRMLARYHRWADVITLCEYLLSMVPADVNTETIYNLRVDRAFAVLHEDRLYDADRAISDLAHNPRAAVSAHLAMLEIYRHVKTGHNQDAIDYFAKSIERMRQQLGMRLGEAYGLVARAFDVLGNADEAGRYYQRATVLVPEVELHSQYEEIAKLAGRYAPASRPDAVAPAGGLA